MIKNPNKTDIAPENKLELSVKSEFPIDSQTTTEDKLVLLQLRKI